MSEVKTGLFMGSNAVKLRFKNCRSLRSPEIDAEHVLDQFMDAFAFTVLTTKPELAGRFQMLTVLTDLFEYLIDPLVLTCRCFDDGRYPFILSMRDAKRQDRLQCADGLICPFPIAFVD